jgi:hypothetical protein
VEKEGRLDHIYGKNIETIEKLKQIGKNSDNENRYLICNDCFGYYKLKDNEHPKDFEGCECGNSMEYHQNIEIIDKFDFSNSNKTSNDYYPESTLNTEHNDKEEEIQEIVDLIKNDSKERKKILDKLYENIKNQEMVLKNIKNEKIMEIKNNNWSLWEHIENNEIENNISDQKMIIDEIMEQENRLLSKVKDKRKTNSLIVKDLMETSYGKLAILIWSLIFLFLVIIYLIK